MSRALLLLAGICGLAGWPVLCLLFVYGSSMASSFGNPSPLPGLLEYALVFAPLATFASYVWIARRPFPVSALLLWGVVAHLPFLKWLRHYQEHPAAFALAVALVAAMAIYAAYVRTIWASSRTGSGGEQR